MPKRIVHGEGLWRSGKLAQVEPESFRAEYANLLPLALANGSFECEPRRIWAEVYSYNRPSVTVEMIERVLAEFERVKLLFRWTDRDGKTWGYWVGIEKPGRLPSASRLRKGHESTGSEPPADTLAAFLGTNGQPEASHGVANGRLGFGSGSGSGLGSGSGTHEREQKAKSELRYIPEADDGLDGLVLQVFHTHPANAHLKGKISVPQEQEQAIAEAIQRDGVDAVLAGTRNLRDAISKWPKTELRFVPNPVKFYRGSEYLKDPIIWDKAEGTNRNANPYGEIERRAPSDLPVNWKPQNGRAARAD